MDTASLKSFATSARVELIREVSARITAVLPQTSSERVEQPRAVTALEHAISTAGEGATGTAHVAERVAYTWFNRIVALRFMDANGYTSIGIVSPAADQVGQPEILAAAKRGQIDGGIVRGANSATIMGLLNGTRQPRPGVDAQAEAYTLLLADYCRFWNHAMPFMFEGEGDFTELLIPANLLAEDSVLNRSVKALTQEVCRDVEVIGWLYQYYISERKDEVFAGFKKNKKAGADEIPAATQLFTPHWIVRYLVENSVGRLWMLNHPESRIVDKMDYYIAPVDEETDILKITTPEELTVIDPACGSGHMLTYAFDLLYLIYEEEGYTPSQIPGLILTHNLYGTEIDPRAGALAAFALTMKAVARRKLFFKNPVAPNICVVEALSFRSDEIVALTAAQGEALVHETYWNQFEFADTLGSLIRPDSSQTMFVKSALEHSNLDNDIIYSETVDRARKVIRQAEMLSSFYAVVVANPPYMGSKQMNGLLSQFMKDEFGDVKQDLYGAFVVRAIELANSRGLLAIVIGDTWMSIKSFEAMRLRLLKGHAFDSFVHMRDVSNHPDIFGANAAFVLSVTGARNHNAPFIRLTSLGSGRKEQDLRIALAQRTQETGFHLASGEEFSTIPGTPIVYWLSEKMRAAFNIGRPMYEIGTPKAGMHGGDVNRFARRWFEVNEKQSIRDAGSISDVHASGRKWVSLNKGGAFRKWYGNQEYVLAFDKENYEILKVSGNKLPSRDFYFMPSVSWSKVSSGSPAFRMYPKGFVFDVSGTPVFSNASNLLSICAISNSEPARKLLEAMAPTLNFEIGQVAALPILTMEEVDPDHSRVKQLIAEAQLDWDSQETSWNYERNPLVRLINCE